MKKYFQIAGAACSALLFAASASAVSYSFVSITAVSAQNNAADQVFVDVINGTAGTVRFNFTFAAGDAGTITEIGFAGASTNLLTNTGAPTIFNGPGVTFVHSTQFTGGYDLALQFGGERAQGQGFNVSDGMSNGETLGLQYTLAAGKTLNDITNALTGGTFYVGMHIQQLDDGGSQKADIGGPNPPRVSDTGSTISLLGLGLLTFAAARRKVSA